MVDSDPLLAMSLAMTSPSLFVYTSTSVGINMKNVHRRGKCITFSTKLKKHFPIVFLSEHISFKVQMR